VTRFGVLVEVSLRPGIADPQGATIERSLPALGFDDVTSVRVGKAIRLVVDAPDREAALRRVEDLCQRFLTNPVIEEPRIELAVAEVGAEPRP
jgi:phosphoribosylformylglycinamidine synthase PurS subunit